MSDHPSGQPNGGSSDSVLGNWQSPNGRGIPTVPGPRRADEAPPDALEPVAEWLGWSPTSWRSRGRR